MISLAARLLLVRGEWNAGALWIPVQRETWFEHAELESCEFRSGSLTEWSLVPQLAPRTRAGSTSQGGDAKVSTSVAVARVLLWLMRCLSFAKVRYALPTHVDTST